MNFPTFDHWWRESVYSVLRCYYLRTHFLYCKEKESLWIQFQTSKGQKLLVPPSNLTHTPLGRKKKHSNL